jgi:hypothetical protein
MAKFFITVRSVAADAFGDNLGPIRYLVVPDGDIPAPAHAVTQSAWIRQIMATFPPDANGVPNGDLLFVVHGYNLAVADVDAQQRNVTAGLAGKLRCTIISFDWPSRAETFAYLPQLDVAKKTAIDLVNAGVKPMLAAQKKDCRVAIHILCHSMGAYVVREALDHADDGLETGTDWMVNQLVMIAGDVDAADFVAGNKDTESMLGHAYRITNYFNRYDEVCKCPTSSVPASRTAPAALGCPKPLRQKPSTSIARATSRPFAGPATIRLHKQAWSHGWYFTDQNFYSDFAETMRGAVDRVVIAGRTPGPGRTLVLEV